MFLFSCLVLKGLEMEKSTEFNLVENKTKAYFSAQSIQERDMKTSQKLKSEGNWDLYAWLCAFDIYKGGKTKMDLCFKKQESMWI